MITRLAIWWVRRQGWEVERPHWISLTVSGNALALREDEEGLLWTISFPVKPHVITKRGSLVCGANRTFQGAKA
jgi:hypothetical protein